MVLVKMAQAAHKDLMVVMVLVIQAVAVAEMMVMLLMLLVLEAVLVAQELTHILVGHLQLLLVYQDITQVAVAVAVKIMQAVAQEMAVRAVAVEVAIM